MTRTILATATLTSATLLLLGTLFMQGILGSFGYALATVERLDTLRQSQAVVERLRERTQKRKAQLSRRFAKRTGQRLAATALAASTIGTVAVVATVATLEVDDYCQQRGELHSDLNLLLGGNTPFDTGQCIEEAKQDAEAIARESLNEIGESLASGLADTQAYSAAIWERIKASSLEAFEVTGSAAGEWWESLRLRLDE